MSVELDPAELGFRRPFTHEVTQLLRLRNPGANPIAFKVKTTAPKQYCVRPNSGRIEPGSEVEVQVLLQAMKEDPPPDARCRDKFLVQSVDITPERDMSNIAATWQNVEKTSKAAIQERKIRVVFLPSDISSHHSNVNGAHEDAPPAYGSPAPSFGSPAPDAVTPLNHTVENPAGITSQNHSQRSDGKDTGDSKESTNSITSNIQSTLGVVASGVANAIPLSGDDPHAQLSDVKGNVMKLRQQDEEQSPRRRADETMNQDSRERITTGTTGMGIQPQTADGVPVQIVAALCLLSFLLAYFFF
ncbi:phosphatidylinositol-binding protein scs2 [Pseudocyphellaria aurata]|nr:phosphatidylinositol-binding protein scs2 [Pseudocyphellaria aurata]